MGTLVEYVIRPCIRYHAMIMVTICLPKANFYVAVRLLSDIFINYLFLDIFLMHKKLIKII
jgi:hypothetical protein